MGLNISQSGGGAFPPTVKFNAKIGEWSFRAPDIEQMIIDPPTALFDLKNIQTGHLLFRSKEKPLRTFDPSLEQMAEKVDPDQKRGFMLHLYSTKFAVPGLAEFSATAKNVNDAVTELYTAYEGQAAANPGKLPIVECGPAKPTSGMHGTNYRPTLTIVGWADRPADLPDALPCPDEIGRPMGAAPNGVGAHVPPPPPAATSPSNDLPF